MIGAGWFEDEYTGGTIFGSPGSGRERWEMG